MIINQVGTSGTSKGSFLRRSACGYASYDAETQTYVIRLNDHTIIGEIITDGGYIARDIDDDHGGYYPLGRFDTITQALRAIFGKPGTGYTYYELA